MTDPGVFFPHWRENEIIRPVTYLLYWIGIIIAALVLIVGLIASPASAWMLHPDAGSINESSNFSGHIIPHALDDNLGTYWQNKGTGGYLNWTNPGGLTVSAISIYSGSGWVMTGSEPDVHYPLPFYTQWKNFTINSTTSWIQVQGDGTIYLPVFEWKVGDGLPNEVLIKGDPLSGSNPLSVAFTVQNVTNQNIIWNFGDGTTENVTGFNVNHVYTAAGIYDVSINYTDSDDLPQSLTVEDMITVADQPVYNMTVNPTEINAGGSVYATFSSSTGSFALVNAMTLICQYRTGSGGTACTYNGNDPTFINTGGVWKQWNSTTKTYSITYGSSFPNGLNLEGFDAPGQYSVEGTLFQFDDYSPPKMTGYINVSGDGRILAVSMNVKDMDTQGYINGATASLVQTDGSITNKTVSWGPVVFNAPAGSYLGYTASANGYDPMGIAYFQLTENKVIDIPLSKTKTYAENTTGLRCFVRTGSGGSWVAIEGASVRVEDGNGQTKITPASGMVEFTVATNSTYYVTASKTGYTDVTLAVDVGEEPVSVSLELGRTTISPTAQPTAVVTVCDENGCHVVTAVPTVDTRTDAEKDADLAGQVRDIAPQLVGFFIVLIFIGGFQLINKGM